MHWVTAGDRCIMISMYNRNACEGKQVLNAQNLNETFILIVVLGVNKSPSSNISSTITIYTTFCYSVEYGGSQGE